MLILSTNQVRALDDAVRNEYVRKICSRVETGFPDLRKTCGDKFVPAVERIVDMSGEWGLPLNDHVVRLVYLMLSYELSFLSKPDKHIHHLMTWPSRTPEDKLTYLHEYLIEKHNAIIPS